MGAPWQTTAKNSRRKVVRDIMDAAAQAGLDHADVAALMEVQAATVRNWWSGKSLPGSLQTLKSKAVAAGLLPADYQLPASSTRALQYGGAPTRKPQPKRKPKARTNGAAGPLTWELPAALELPASQATTITGTIEVNMEEQLRDCSLKELHDLLSAAMAELTRRAG